MSEKKFFPVSESATLVLEEQGPNKYWSVEDDNEFGVKLVYRKGRVVVEKDESKRPVALKDEEYEFELMGEIQSAEMAAVAANNIVSRYRSGCTYNKETQEVTAHASELIRWMTNKLADILEYEEELGRKLKLEELRKEATLSLKYFIGPENL